MDSVTAKRILSATEDRPKPKIGRPSSAPSKKSHHKKVMAPSNGHQAAPARDLSADLKLFNFTISTITVMIGDVLARQTGGKFPNDPFFRESRVTATLAMANKYMANLVPHSTEFMFVAIWGLSFASMVAPQGALVANLSHLVNKVPKAPPPPPTAPPSPVEEEAPAESMADVMASMAEGETASAESHRGGVRP